MIAESKAFSKKRKQPPKSPVAGGPEYFSKLKNYLVNQLGNLTAAQYYRKTVQISDFWGRAVKHFVLDKLLEALDLNIKFPSLSSYFLASTTKGDH